MDFANLLPYASLFAGLALLVGAGEILIRGAVGVATRLGVPTLIIGMTIIALGTSAPELVVGVDAVRKGAPTLALGNVVGSNIANILLVLGLPALIAPIACTASKLGRNLSFMIAISILMIAISFFSDFTFYTGAIMVALLAGFLVLSARRARSSEDRQTEETEVQNTIEDVGVDPARPPSMAKASVFLVFGLFGIIWGADLLVDGSVTIARSLGVSEAVIGLTLVAIGTSLPELVTSIAAALKGHSDVAVGNVVGSNIFNILGILGVSSMVGDIPTPESFKSFDLWVMLGASLMLIPIFMSRGSIGKRYGGLMAILYFAYIIYSASTGGT